MTNLVDELRGGWGDANEVCLRAADEIESLRKALDNRSRQLGIQPTQVEPGVGQSPLAQAVLDRVDGTNLGLFITSAVDHIESGGNYASTETTLGSGVKIEVRLSRVIQQGERLWGLESRLPGGEWTTYYAIYPRLLTAESAARHGGPPGSEWRVVEYQKVASNALKSSGGGS